MILKRYSIGRHLCSVVLYGTYQLLAINSPVSNEAQCAPVWYSVCLRLNKKTGEILNSKCECPAGAEPYSRCKHVAAVVVLIDTFVTTGGLKIRSIATDKLQTFHKPRRTYTGINPKRWVLCLLLRGVLFSLCMSYHHAS